MKITSLTEFVSQANDTADMISKYLSIHLNRNLREINNAFKNITFIDNFETFQFEGTVLANSELAIRNQFRGGITPTKRIIVRGDAYSPYVVDGDSPWSKDFVYLKNTHATENAILTVIFFK